MRFAGGKLGTDFTHHESLVDYDGGNGMIFADEDKLYLAFRSPNKGFEKLRFLRLRINDIYCFE